MCYSITAGQIQTVLVYGFHWEQVFDVLQGMFLPLERACEAVFPKNELRLNAGCKPVLADGAGGPASLLGSSDDIHL